MLIMCWYRDRSIILSDQVYDSVLYHVLYVGESVRDILGVPRGRGPRSRGPVLVPNRVGRVNLTNIWEHDKTATDNITCSDTSQLDRPISSTLHHIKLRRQIHYRPTCFNKIQIHLLAYMNSPCRCSSWSCTWRRGAADHRKRRSSRWILSLPSTCFVWSAPHSASPAHAPQRMPQTYSALRSPGIWIIRVIWCHITS